MALLPGVSFQWHTPRGLLPGASSQGALPNYILNGTNHDENMSFECERDAQCTFYNDYKRFWTKKHNLRCNCFENTHFGTKKHNFRCKCFENAHFEQKTHNFQCKCFENAHFEQKNTNFNANASKMLILEQKTQISMQMLRKYAFWNKKHICCAKRSKNAHSLTKT